ncbi:hypothetical protein QE152_g29346 [Popillia japonica]|uniref:Uncharacterized protein n=1 Tax=Popillia japonica TaxID=7064 RepID=A0AAW1JIB0_POPJA
MALVGSIEQFKSSTDDFSSYAERLEHLSEIAERFVFNKCMQKQGYEATLVTKENATLVFHKPYAMPMAMRKPVEDELNQMVNDGILIRELSLVRFIHADCLKSTTLGSDSLTEPLVPVTQTEYRPVSNFDGPNHVQDPQEPPKAEIAGRESKNSCTAEDTSKESSKPKTPLAQTPIAHRPKRTINPPKRLDL